MKESESLLKALVPDTYIQQGLQGLAKRHSLFRQLLEHRRLPEKGWDDATIELVLHELALMDRYVIWLTLLSVVPSTRSR